MPESVPRRRVEFALPGHPQPVRVSAERAQEGRIAPRSTGPTLVSSIWVDRRRYDSWRTVEILESRRAARELASVPLLTWVLIVHGPRLE